MEGFFLDYTTSFEIFCFVLTAIGMKEHNELVKWSLIHVKIDGLFKAG